jgi:5-methyltetrahydropteroyltriglutamate--homocysteine methyltransferase
MAKTTPTVLTTTVGSYPVPAWLSAFPTEEAVKDAIRVVVDTQRQAGIDLPTDGELYRFDVNHPDTNGMIEYFIKSLAGVRAADGWDDWREFRKKDSMSFRTQPAGVVDGPIRAGGLNLPGACARTTDLVGKNIKFTVTSPYMLARTLLDHHHGSLESLTLELADVLAGQVADVDCACIQVDEANIPGNPTDAPLAAEGINRLLRAAKSESAVHFCFGNYGGQSIQSGTWQALISFLNSLECGHLVMELAHRPDDDLAALKEIRPGIDIGLGVIDIKVNHIESADVVARRIEAAARVIGPERIRWVHPDCGFWMLKRSIADRKIAALVAGRDLYEGRATGSAQ